MRCSIVFAVLLASSALTVGCSRSAEESSATPTHASTAAARTRSAPLADPCKLLTQEEAAAAIGRSVTRSDLQHYGRVNRCRFFSADGDEPIWLDAEDAAMFDAVAHLPDAKPLSGIADQAFWQHNELSTFVHILKNGRMVSMGLPRTMSTLTPEAEKAAKLVASRM